MSSGRLPVTDQSLRSLPVGRLALHSASIRGHPYRRGSPVASGLAGVSSATSQMHNAVSQAHATVAGPSSGVPIIPTYHGGDVGIGDMAVASPQHAPASTTPPNLSPWSSHSSLQDGDNLHTRFTAYAPPNMPSLDTAQNSVGVTMAEASPGSSACVSVEDVEYMLRAMSLDAERSTVLRYNQMAVNEKLTVLFLHVLRLSYDLKDVTLHATASERRLASIEELIQQAWRPSKAQVLLIRSLVRHFLVKPINNYHQLPDYVKSYVADHAKELRLGLYLKDKTVKTTVNMLISELATQMKSAFRKAVFASCKKKIPLHSFARNMLDNYHLPVIPAEIPLPVLGTLALMREIAEPLAKKANSTKGDTGFWRALQEELDTLCEDFKSGDRLSDLQWIQWASKKVRDDGVRFPVAGGRFSAATREELDRALGSSANHENQDVDILDDGEGSSPHSNDQDLEDEEMDGDVEVSRLGDVAATVQMNVTA